MMTKVGIDLRGGDHAPTAILEGLHLAKPLLKDQTELHLFGLAEDFQDLEEGPWKTHACTQFISMEEHPVKALQAKPDSTMVRGLYALKTEAIDSWASAGHSGALMVASMQALGLMEGITRPVVVSLFPKLNGESIAVLDVGINVDAKAEQFLEFAELGSAYAKALMQKPNPKMALLNTGTESSKGSMVYQKAHRLLQEGAFSFEGNLEARDLYDNDIDVLLCDGFTGNMVLKQTEAFYSIAQKRGVQDSFIAKMNYENYGASPILGVKGKVLLAHGASGPEAIKSMILSAESFALANFAE